MTDLQLHYARIAFDSDRGNVTSIREDLIDALLAQGQATEVLKLAKPLPEYSDTYRRRAAAHDLLGQARLAEVCRVQADAIDESLQRALDDRVDVDDVEQRVAGLRDWLGGLDQTTNPGAHGEARLALARALISAGDVNGAVGSLDSSPMPTTLQSDADAIRLAVRADADALSPLRAALALAQRSENSKAIGHAHAALGIALWKERSPDAWTHLEAAAMNLPPGPLSNQVFAAIDEMDSAGMSA